MGPVDPPVGVVEAGAAALEERPELAVDLEALGHPQELLVERAQRVLRHRRARLAAHRPVELVLSGVGRPGHRLLELGMGVGHALVGPLGDLARVVGGDHVLGRQPLGVELADRRVLLDPLVHERLRVGGLVGLVVAEAPVADQVDQRVAVEGLAEGVRQADGRDAGLHVVGVHVDDRDVEALGEVGRVARRAALLGVGGEAELVVGDHVDRAAGRVARERLQVERLGHDALAREGGVAVDQHRQHRVGVVGRARAPCGWSGRRARGPRSPG